MKRQVAPLLQPQHKSTYGTVPARESMLDAQNLVNPLRRQALVEHHQDQMRVLNAQTSRGGLDLLNDAIGPGGRFGLL